jgi:hypothetical protein
LIRLSKTSSSLRNSGRCVEGDFCRQTADRPLTLPSRLKNPLLDVLKTLDESFLTPETLARLAEASLAVETATATHLDEVSRKTEGEGLERLLGGIWSAGGRRARSGDVPGDEKKTKPDERVRREERRARWREAALLLPHPAGEDEHKQHTRSVSDDWEELHEAPAVPVLRFHLETVETTLAAVRSGAASFGISFVPDVWEGLELFVEDEPGASLSSLHPSFLVFPVFSPGN